MANIDRTPDSVSVFRVVICENFLNL